MDRQIYWNQCACNEYDALVRRHYCKPITGDEPAALALFREEMNRCSEAFSKFKKMDYQKVMFHTRSSIRARYARAFSSLNSGRIFIGKKEARLSGFVKYEKIPEGKWLDKKAPRLIQFRSFEYLYTLKSYLLKYSLQVKEADVDRRWNDQPVHEILTKTMDGYGCANVMRKAWDEFTDPVALCLDHSRFDGHYDEFLLTQEHQFWLGLCMSRGLSRILKLQIKNNGVTAGGLSWKAKYKRASGEYTTSDGNSLSNYVMLVVWLKMSGISRFRVFVNGDDSVVMIDRGDEKKLRPLTFFNNFGMETEMDRCVDQFQRITYCQTSPVRVKRNDALTWYMCKTPLRAMSRFCYSVSQYAACSDRYLLGSALCDLACNSGIPILQNFSLRVVSDCQHARPLGSVDKSAAMKSGNMVELKDICFETRQDFAIAFGIDVYDQFLLEAELAAETRFTQNLQSIVKKYKLFHLR